MDEKMFCFQCEQTAGCSGCTGNAGVCGKTAAVAELQDELTGALVPLARAAGCNGKSDRAIHLMLKSLFTTITNVNFNEETLGVLIKEVNDEKNKLIGNKTNNCSGAENYDMNKLWHANEDIRSLKSLILFGLRGMGAYAYHAAVLGYTDEAVNEFFFEGMRAVGNDEFGQEELLPLVLKLGEVNITCMAMLDKANTETYGNPVPVDVPLLVEKGPFIVITGHDLYDLKQLLEQTKDKGINIYTHGEMLPAHGYPELKKYPQLKGNFGTAWQSQQKEFANMPAPVLFTTNCLMPPKDSYKDRVYTTEVVSYPEIVHIGEDKDFSEVIAKSLELGGYKEDTQFTGINGGSKVTTGYARNTILSNAGTIVDAVKAGKISHFFLVGGCDGAKPGRNYYTDFVKQTPADSIILTLACGKFRFNDLDLGTVAGFPRILDMGQCNDAYGAVQVAFALAKAFDCSVNELPLSMNISWYEQKAVCILLSLLHLGIKNILLGPTLPAFISPNVLNILIENYNLGLISTPEKDLEKFLG